MPNPNIYFDHIHNVQKMLDEAKDIQSVLAAVHRVRALQQVWSDIADHIRQVTQNAADTTVEDEILQDIVALCIKLDNVQKELGELKVNRPAPPKEEAKGPKLVKPEEPKKPKPKTGPETSS
jgi:hypothetical protein